MDITHAPIRSLDEWMKMITECRKSGLSDAAWCRQQGISVSSFYNAATRLRKRACTIPEPMKNTGTYDLTSAKQDVVRVAVKQEVISSAMTKRMDTISHLDNSHTIELQMDDVTIRMSNSVDPMLLQQIIRSVRLLQC